MSTELSILDPAELRFLRRGARLHVTVGRDRSWLNVNVVRAFPISAPGGHLCVLDGEGGEVGLLESVERLDAESRRLVTSELQRRYVIPRVLRVLSVTERFGTVEWEVETDRGQRAFSTRNLRDNTRQLSGSRTLVIDVDDNRYEMGRAELQKYL
jgi:hypothetical protein